MSGVTSSSLIFQAPSGVPYRFFVEAAAVRGRPAIVRKIASNGGKIVTKPRESDILLAENFTREAVELLEAWSGEKVVLSTRWLTRCIESNTFLGAQANWGDCLLNRDSMAVDGPDEHDRDFPPLSKKRKLSNFAEETVVPLSPGPLPAPPPPLPPPSLPQFENNTAPPPALPLTYPSSSQPNGIAQSTLLASMLGGSSQPQAHQWDVMSLLPLLALGQLNNNNPQLLAAQLHELADRLLAGQIPASSASRAVPSTPLTSRIRSSPLEVANNDSCVLSEGEVENFITVSNRKRKSREGDDERSNARAESSPEYKEGIFTQGGKSMKFYIMLDIQQRKQFLQLVRKHGGQIVMKMDDADNIILNNRSSQFQKTNDLVPVGKIALSHGWLDECDKEGVLVPKAPYILDAESGIGRGLCRRKIKTPSSKMKRSKEQDEREYDSEESNSVASYPAGMASSSQRRSERSPSPPEPSTPRGARSNHFTMADREWFFRYVRAKFEQKPEISWSVLTKMVARKAPYHTATSWHNAARTKWNDEYQLVSREQTQNLRQHYPKYDIVFQTPQKTIRTPLNEPANPTTSHTNQQSTQVKREEEAVQLDQLFNETG